MNWNLLLRRIGLAILTIWVWLLAIMACCLADLSIEPVNETGWTTEICNQYDMEDGVTTFDHRFCDIVWGSYAFEVDWPNKWEEGVGQSLGYASALRKKPGVILLRRGRRDDLEINRCLAAVAGSSVDIEIWVYDTTKRKFTRGGPPVEAVVP